MAFTTWAAFLENMKDDLADGSWKLKSYSVGGDTFEYRDLAEFMKLFRDVERRAANEAGTTVGRTCAGQGGTGRW